MDQKHREIIEEYRNLICNNLIVSEDFYRTLLTHGVFTDGIIKDIKKAPRGEAQSHLLNAILTQSQTDYGKFCDVLELTGHHFLSDCLREAENMESTHDLDLEAFAKQMPFIGKSIKNDQQKIAIQKYFKDKIHNEVAKQTWRADISTKERLMVARQQRIEHIWQHEEESKIKDKGAVELHKDYMKLQTRTDDFRREIKSVHKIVEDMTRKHKVALKTQVKFNVANDRHKNRLNDRAEDADSYLDDIHLDIREILGEEYTESQARTNYENLTENFGTVIDRHKKLATLAQRFRQERAFLSNQLTTPPVGDDGSLKPHLQEFIIKNEEAKAQLQSKVHELEETSEGQQRKIEELNWVQKKLDIAKKRQGDSNHDYEQLRHQIEGSSQKLKARDVRIQVLETDVQKMMARIQDVENRLAQSQESEKKARLLASQQIRRTPLTKTPSSRANPPSQQGLSDQRAMAGVAGSTHYNKKPTATRSTGVFLLDDSSHVGSSLDAIQGFGMASGENLPPGVKSQGNVKAAVKQAGTANASTARVPKLAASRPNRRT